jgi:hypothetical protein
MSARQILRYSLPIDDKWHTLPGGYVAHVAPSRSHPREIEVWIDIEPFEQFPQCLARVFGTGQDIPPTANHLGTCISRDLTFVWHVFEERLTSSAGIAILKEQGGAE